MPKFFEKGIFYCCINFGNRKGLDKREGEFQGFPSKNSCLTVPKSHGGESFIVALVSGSEKFYGQQGGGEYQEFPSRSFSLTVPKFFAEESSTVAVMSGTGNVWIRRGSIKTFRRNFFAS